MYRDCRHRMMVWVTLIGVVLSVLCSCSDSDGLDNGNDDVMTVNAHFTFALPRSIVGTRQKAGTRMTPDVVEY